MRDAKELDGPAYVPDPMERPSNQTTFEELLLVKGLRQEQLYTFCRDFPCDMKIPLFRAWLRPSSFLCEPENALATYVLFGCLGKQLSNQDMWDEFVTLEVIFMNATYLEFLMGREYVMLPGDSTKFKKAMAAGMKEMEDYAYGVECFKGLNVFRERRSGE